MKSLQLFIWTKTSSTLPPARQKPVSHLKNKTHQTVNFSELYFTQTKLLNPIISKTSELAHKICVTENSANCRIKLNKRALNSIKFGD